MQQCKSPCIQLLHNACIFNQSAFGRKEEEDNETYACPPYLTSGDDGLKIHILITLLSQYDFNGENKFELMLLLSISVNKAKLLLR